MRILDSTNGFSVSSASNNASYVSFGTKNDGYTISFITVLNQMLKLIYWLQLILMAFTLDTGTLANATVFKI